MPSIVESKQQWRFTLRQIRQQCAAQGSVDAAQLAAEQLRTLPEWNKADCIAVYRAIGDELDPCYAAANAAQAGKRLVYPRIVGPGELVFCDWRAGQPLETSIGGIAQPTAAAAIANVDAIDFFLIPLLGCDLAGFCLGYGGGFYDRALASAEGFRCGVGYEAQIIAALPREPHDEAMQCMVTELGVHRFAPLSAP
jgi:5-formyltetrahydrofolate cyclo-ligase